MLHENKPGQIVILNGTPRSGKTSIATVIQNTFDGVWLNLGVDRFMAMTPKRYYPGIGLRPGAHCPDLEPLIVTLYQAMYESIAVHSRLGINVVVDVGHHDGYSVPRGILPKCAGILKDLPVLLVGVRCPLETVMERRIATWNMGYSEDGSVPRPVVLWQESVHVPGIYDLEVDTSQLSSEECADLIRKRLENGQSSTAFQRIADMRTEAD
ncbi:chloramphenicol phosphotransferase [Alicyclobacillus fastidiosus]|uniref:Chloramphenicol phosphotransferase n=1 Tax=Alicyclobacillus fastidiosus TaxID=392011 RepID=A0ABY6ZAU8_9BACL|nr:chloramphenicol phosphotransferase [Alicyclobacillus fastidiosus]WAH40013.1 chloramphenicol phosphotransferase [Alicyclobacillus fastidiosus]GMA61310.1 chloramphenicol phosphotransferase [Alicyclobacillus fastidiosus]